MTPGERTHCPQGHPYDEANTYRRKGRNNRMCRACARARMRRVRTGRYQRSHPERSQAWKAAHSHEIARKSVRNAVRDGRLERRPCEVCGSQAVEGHHAHGYAPEHALDVQWLCAPHHKALHRGAQS
jgi:hypothetical protein